MVIRMSFSVSTHVSSPSSYSSAPPATPLEVRSSSKSAAPPPHPIFILSEMNLCVLSAEQRLLVSHWSSSKTTKGCESPSAVRTFIEDPLSTSHSFPTQSKLSGTSQNSAWNNLGDPNNNNTNSSSFQNITRTGKPIDDLDESDLISMGYKHSDKSIFRDKSDILKNQACRSLLEQNESRKISLPSEKTLIRLNPTPNVTPTIEGIAEIRNHHLMDEPDESIDPNSETLIDKGGQLHPLSSTIRCSQSPIGKQMHMPD
ncbi:Putative LOC101846341, partial [Caligus rogercresseyi]